MSDRALDWGTQPIHLGIEFLLPVKQFPALRLLKRGDKARTLEAYSKLSLKKYSPTAAL